MKIKTKGIPILNILRGKYRKLKHKFQFPKNTIPLPHELKMDIIKTYFFENNSKIFIETGTYEAATTKVISTIADFTHTIELSEYYYNQALETFKTKPNVKCHLGSSEKILPEILQTENKKIIFWLDGHYSGGLTAKGEEETPILKELKVIKAYKVKNSVILIDDARLFGSGDYPSLETLYEEIHNLWKNCKIKNEYNIISFKI